jgi:hypothetical protein
MNENLSSAQSILLVSFQQAKHSTNSFSGFFSIFFQHLIFRKQFQAVEKQKRKKAENSSADLLCNLNLSSHCIPFKPLKIFPDIGNL